MASQTDILNLAILKLAQSDTIPNISDESNIARVGVRLWQHCVDLVLSDRIWDFAMKSEVAALVTDPPSPGWTYRYEYPNDCLKLEALVDSQNLALNPDPVYWCWYEWPVNLMRLYQWRKGWGPQGTCVDAYLPEAIFLYTVRMTDADTERFPPHFVEALACKLAQFMAPPVIGSVGLNAQTSLEQAYQFALSRASALDGNEGVRVDAMTPSLRARED